MLPIFSCRDSSAPRRDRSGLTTGLQIARVAIAAAGLIVSILGLALGVGGAFACPAEPTAAVARGVQNPLSTIQRHAPRAVSGVVKERVRAGSYTYLLVAQPDGPRWSVIMGAGPAEGEVAKLTIWGASSSFRSARLNKTFSSLQFASAR